MTGYLISFAAGFIPMLIYAWLLYYLDRYEKEPLKLLVGMFLWGALIAASAAFVINSISSMGLLFLTQSDLAAQFATSTLIAPFVEETLKGAAILIVFLLFKPDFDSPLDGIVYGGIAALGFAATENIWYIHQYGYLQNGIQGLQEIALIRVVLVGWQHPFYTSFTGLGFALARQTKNSAWQLAFPFLGWIFATVFHLLHNLFAMLVANTGRGGLMNLIWDWSGYLGLLFLVILLITREQSWMKSHLFIEVESGRIDPSHYQIACSAWRQSLAFFRSIFAGNFPQTRSYYQACGDLMHKLRQTSRHGSDPLADQEIERLRTKLASLSHII